MKTEKSFEEAIFRARQGTEGSQPQEQLYALNQQAHHASPYTSTHHDNQLNESHKNLMQSWLNLRRMDRDLAETGKL